MAQPFFSRVCILLTICLTPLAVYAENYDTWSDSAYDFSSVHTIYVDTLDTSSLQTDTPLKVYRLKKDFQKKAAAVKGVAVVMPALEPPAPSALRQESSKKEAAKKEAPVPQSVEIKHATTSDPAANMPSENISAESANTAAAALPKKSAAAISMSSPMPVVIPQAAVNANADAYVTAQLLTYHVGTGLIPAHTEWNSYSVRDVYYDRNGHPHWFYHDVSYPVYVPDAYVPMATVRVRFAVYDIKTGKLVFCSEDMRTRGSSDDLRGVYQRIIDRFFKNLKKELKK